MIGETIYSVKIPEIRNEYPELKDDSEIKLSELAKHICKKLNIEIKSYDVNVPHPVAAVVYGGGAYFRDDKNTLYMIYIKNGVTGVSSIRVIKNPPVN